MRDGDAPNRFRPLPAVRHRATGRDKADALARLHASLAAADDTLQAFRELVALHDESATSRDDDVGSGAA